MPIVPRPRWSDLSSWGLWLIVVFVTVLSPWRMSWRGSSSQPALLPAAPMSAESLEVWHSPYAAVPWFSRSSRARWQWAGYSVEQWRKAGQAWALLERLQVRAILNRYGPTESPVDHGAVAVVLVLTGLDRRG